MVFSLLLREKTIFVLVKQQLNSETKGNESHSE